ncbi:LOW QUALITY PROTEIN: lysophospholipid acyltransferase 7 [Lepeophtheirus salmonis]|uniref:LOW QUALITY PROTEIN: lysophospholipid acyltransferase 7 n=1 Tax=Lepeophtheirus salmonis TaxID=72036 RepID=UPI001AEA0933|nr:LOW QUALITY PROTEIN: lysophospholipid acyltransferase 7-like [Lepeophtheirus salmonis]
MIRIESDYLYLLLLVLSVFYGKVLRSLYWDKPLARKWASTCAGFVADLIVSGPYLAHQLLSIFFQTLLLRFCPKKSLGLVSFIFNFLYLFFFRLEDYLGIPIHPPISNAIQMILSLKMIGLAFDHQEGSINPSIMDIFHFSFSHATILTGPYVRFRTFNDCYKMEYFKSINCDKRVMDRIYYFPIFISVYFIIGYIFPFSAVLKDDFYETSSVFYRIFYFTPTFTTFRMRFYIGFILAECSCIMYGLGAYPSSRLNKPGHGPSKEAMDSIKYKDEDFDFLTIKNIDPWQTEVALTVRDALRQWNMTVQSWLVHYVYKKCPVKYLRTLSVMIVSSAWHGVHFGYYLSLGSIPLFLFVEDFYDKILRARLPNNYKKYYDIVGWFLRVQAFSYLSMAFQLLHINATLNYWRSIYFIGHVFCIVAYIFGIFIVQPLSNKFLISSRAS